MKRILAMALAFCLVLGMVPTAFAARSSYQDVPGDSWALPYIETAKEKNWMQGQGSGSFGYGKTVTMAELSALLCKLLGWEPVVPAKPTYEDVKPGSWYYQAVETAHAHGVFDAVEVFEPLGAISRKELAKAFVRALGLGEAAALEERLPAAFSDLDQVPHGYENVARYIGLMEGKSATRFAPDDLVKREEAAAVLVRFGEKYRAKTDFVHGFYAISAYSQRDLAEKMDAVTYQWSAMTPQGALDTAGTIDSQLRVPDSYDSITKLLDGKTKTHLGVYMDAKGGAQTLLLDPAKRTAAVNSIVAELTKSYDLIGKNPYSGVSVDFESMKGAAVKQAFSAFLAELSAKLKPMGATLYVTVPPVLEDGVYYDGYDYKAIGEVADKVILMAHDYNPTSLEGYEGTAWQNHAALTPIAQVYYALKAATDPKTGVRDTDKLALAISFASLGWYITPDGKLANPTPVHVSPGRVAEVLSLPDTKTGFSEIYRNPYLTYRTQEGETIFLWYENARSVSEKLSLAKCFGITGVSLWRLGTIPNTPGYNVMDSLQ